MQEKSVREAVAEWSSEVKEQQEHAQTLINTIASMGVDVSELDLGVVLDSLASEGLRLAPMDEHKNIASLAYFDLLLPNKAGHSA